MGLHKEKRSSVAMGDELMMWMRSEVYIKEK